MSDSHPSRFTPFIVSVKSLAEAGQLQQQIGVTGEGVRIMAPKTYGRAVRVCGLDPRAANILKQDMLSLGGEVALPRHVHELERQPADALILGTPRRLRRLAKKLSLQPFGLAQLGRELAGCVNSYEAAQNSGLPLPAALGEPRWQIMGILNVTPDSFHDGGRYDRPQAALVRARQLAAEGATIIDVGGESARPGARPVTVAEELERVVPVVEAITAEIDLKVSVDTSKAAVARAALQAGAAMINDVTGLAGDPEMAAVAAEAGCPVCLMHMQGRPQTMQKQPQYEDVVKEVIEFFYSRVEWAQQQGIAREALLLDPGIGFGKTLAHNLQLLKHLDSLLSLGLPLLIGTSRKSFIGAVLGLPASEERLMGTVATSVMAWQKGVQLFRVHDVAANWQALKMAEAVASA